MARARNMVLMLKSDLHPPRGGLGSDPILYGVAAGLADLFPPVEMAARDAAATQGASGAADEDGAERD